MTQANASQSLTQAGLTEAQAQAKFPKYWARLQFEGKPIAKMMATYFGVCAAQDAFWVGHVHAFANVPFPAGSGNIQFGPVSPMKVNNSMWWPYGRMEGVGTFGDSRYNTQLVVDHANWQGDPALRHIILGPSYGRDGVVAYHESAQATNLRLYGAKPTAFCDPSYASSGLVAWDLGEGSHVGTIKADFFNDYGVMNVRGTPAHYDNISGFCNSRAALGLVGTSKGNITVGVISGDDNPVLIDMIEGFGRPAGVGSLVVNNVKCESASFAEGGLGATHKYKGQGVAYLRGQFNVTIIGGTMASVWITSGQMFWVDDRINGVPQNSRVEARGNSYGYGALLIDSRRGTYYSPPADHSDWHMVYTTQDGNLYLNGVLQQPKQYVQNAGPMGFARNGETLNYATATPQQQITGVPPVVVPPNPVACTTWEVGAWSAWGACDPATLTQKRTRTVTAGPAGCTGTPPGVKPATEESQACTITQPPPGGTIATLTNVSVPTVSTNLPVNWPNAKTIVFEGFNTGTAVGGTIAVGNGFALKVGGNGSVYLSVTGSGNIQCVPPIPAGTVKVNTAVNFTANLPAARTFTGLGAFPDSGSGEAFTCSKLTVTG